MTNPRRVHTLATMIDVRLHSAQKLVTEARTIADELLETTRRTIAASLSQGAPMATAHSLPARAKRDVTRALSLVTTLRSTYDSRGMDDNFGELIQLLRNLDARTGRRDPRLRSRRSAKRPTSGKKPAKKARARR